MTDVNVTIGEPIEALLARAAAADRLAASGAALQDAPTYVDFADWEQFARVMTGDRLALLRRLHRRPGDSVGLLAAALRRDPADVQADIAALLECGLIERDAAGDLRADYDGLQTRIAL